MLAAWGLTSRGNKTANFCVLHCTNAPAELAELGFIDNCSVDANYVGNAGRQDSAALGHLYAVQNHYGIASYGPGSGYVVQGGARDKGASWEFRWEWFCGSAIAFDTVRVSASNGSRGRFVSVAVSYPRGRGRSQGKRLQPIFSGATPPGRIYNIRWTASERDEREGTARCEIASL